MMAGPDEDKGLVTQHISKQLESWCQEAHSAFLASRNLHYWRLTVIGLQLPVVLVTSETPGGDVLGPKEIEMTLNFRQDLFALLESHYDQHRQPNPEASG